MFHERAGVTYYNAEGYADQVAYEATIGIDGSWSLHPKQTEQANRIHMPTVEEMERDLHKIESFNEAKREGTGAVVVDGQMVDEATYMNFANTVKRSEPSTRHTLLGLDAICRGNDLLARTGDKKVECVLSRTRIRTSSPAAGLPRHPGSHEREPIQSLRDSPKVRQASRRRRLRR